MEALAVARWSGLMAVAVRKEVPPVGAAASASALALVLGEGLSATAVPARPRSPALATTAVIRVRRVRISWSSRR